MNETLATDAPQQVTGTVIIAAAVPSFREAVLHLRLEDISYADAAAQCLAETRTEHLAHGAGEETAIPFTLAVKTPVEASGAYAVRAWVNLDGGGQPAAGDLFSDQSYRVPTQGFGWQLTIRLGGSGA